MNQRELSTQLNVSEATVSRLGSGHRKPSIDLMERVAAVLKWPMTAQLKALRAGSYPAEFQAKATERKVPRATG